MLRFSVIICCVFFLFSACKKEGGNNHKTQTESELYFLDLPKGFPYPTTPNDNELTKSRVLLGKTLFYDPILSSDSSISCATCHQLNKAFTDGEALSKGIEKRVGMRNSPTLANIAYANFLMLDGGIETLELQVLAPIADHNEMNSDMNIIIERLKKDKNYSHLNTIYI